MSLGICLTKAILHYRRPLGGMDNQGSYSFGPSGWTVGKNAGCSNGCIYSIALDNAFMRNLSEFLKTVSVDEQELGLGVELFDGDVHAFERSPENIDLVDLFIA